MPKKGSMFNKGYIYDLTVDVYDYLLRLEGENGPENSINWYATQYKGGVGEKKAIEIFRNNAQFYSRAVTDTLKQVEIDIEAKGVASKNKKSKHRGGFNIDYIYDLSARILQARIKTDKKVAALMEFLLEKYGSKERAMKRFREKAQVLAPYVRATLRALQAKNQLPKMAIA